jgi:hypothetical protein
MGVLMQSEPRRMQARIFIVDDEPEISDLLARLHRAMEGNRLQGELERHPNGIEKDAEFCARKRESRLGTRGKDLRRNPSNIGTCLGPA